MLRANADNFRIFSVPFRLEGIQLFTHFFGRAPRALVFLRENLCDHSTTNVKGLGLGACVWD